MGVFKETKVFWKDKAKRAFWETLREALGFRSWADIFIKVAVVMATLIALGLFGPDGALLQQAKTYIIIGVVLGLAFILVWIWNFISLPAKDGIEKDLKIAELEAAKDTIEKRRATRNMLGQFLGEGQQIAIRAADESVPPPTKEGDEWLQKLCDYLSNNESLGPAYVARLNNASGLPMAMTSIRSTEHRKINSAVKFRLARIEQFLQEMAN